MGISASLRQNFNILFHDDSNCSLGDSLNDGSIGGLQTSY